MTTPTSRLFVRLRDPRRQRLEDLAAAWQLTLGQTVEALIDREVTGAEPEVVDYDPLPDLRALVAEHGQVATGELIGVSGAAVSRWLSGDRSVSRSRAEQIRGLAERLPERPCG